MGVMLNPILWLGIFAVTLLICLLLFLSLKREMETLRDAVRRDADAAAGEAGELRRAVEALEKKLIEQEAAAWAAPGPMAGDSMNIDKRIQALRLYKRGETPEGIAAALKLPRHEVDLLLKIHRTVVGQH
jgi:hypothetical protein